MDWSPKEKCNRSVPVTVPGKPGVNASAMVQVAPAATWIQSCAALNPGDASRSFRLISLLPVLVTTTLRDPSEVFIDCAPKSRLVEASDAEPGPATVRTRKGAERPPIVITAVVATLLRGDEVWRTQTL